MVDATSIPVQSVERSTIGEQSGRYLFSRAIDFICLGGGSLPILMILLALPAEEYRVSVMITAVMFSHVVNNPHFMHSYQIFYQNFREKLCGASYEPQMHVRYLIAGIIVPVSMVIFFAYAATRPDAVLFGHAVNMMLFLVGWHYVKQGYGILIVESVLKKAFMKQFEKDLFKYNGFAVWIFSWIFSNREIRASELLGLQYYTLDIPEWLFWASGMVALSTSISAAVIAFNRVIIRGERLPVNGMLAYLTSSYVWLLIARVDILLLIVVPVFHSLQYLAVVWRYQLNKGRAVAGGDEERVVLFSGLLTPTKAQYHLGKFVFIGVVLGACAFTVVPTLLDYAIRYKEEVYGPTLFIFLFSIFINVHHYFMDNVMWRKGNPDIKEHLFAAH